MLEEARDRPAGIERPRVPVALAIDDPYRVLDFVAELPLGIAEDPRHQATPVLSREALLEGLGRDDHLASATGGGPVAVVPIGTTFRHIGARLGSQPVYPPTSVQGVVSGATEDQVVPRPPVDLVVPVAAADHGRRRPARR